MQDNLFYTHNKDQHVSLAATLVPPVLSNERITVLSGLSSSECQFRFFFPSPERCCFSNAQGLHFFFAGGVASFSSQQGVFFYPCSACNMDVEEDGSEWQGKKAVKLKCTLCLSRMPAGHFVEQKTHSASAKFRVTLEHRQWGSLTDVLWGKTSICTRVEGPGATKCGPISF